MIEFERSDQYWENSRRTDGKGQAYAPCVICGRAVNVNGAHHMIHVHLGGDVFVTTQEAENLNATGQEASDCGGWPIGPDCLRKHPQFKPYAMRTPAYKGGS